MIFLDVVNNACWEHESSVAETAFAVAFAISEPSLRYLVQVFAIRAILILARNFSCIFFRFF